MKKLLLTIVFAFVAAVAVGQNNYQDVVYLKNGSIVRGIIVEQVPNVSLKIETADGSLFVFQMDDIEKITKERPVNQTPVPQTTTIQIPQSRQNVVVQRDGSEYVVAIEQDSISTPTTTRYWNDDVTVGTYFGFGFGNYPVHNLGLKIMSHMRLPSYDGLGFGIFPMSFGFGFGMHFSSDMDFGSVEFPLYLGILRLRYRTPDVSYYWQVFNTGLWWSYENDLGVIFGTELGAIFRNGFSIGIMFEMFGYANYNNMFPSIGISIGF